MKKWGIALIATVCVASALAVACRGGGDDDDNGDETSTSGTRTATRTARTGTPDADGTGTAGTDETPGASDGTAASGTPATNAQGTPIPNAPTAQGQPTTGSGGTTPTNSGATPGAVDPGTAPTPSDEERAIDDEVDDDLAGGNASDPAEVVTDLPPLPPGATIDPATIAPPNATAGGIEWIVDLNAAEPGIQTSRTVKVGDVVRVGIVVTNLPGGDQAVAAFGAAIGYDYTKIVAPTIEGGSSLARNPDFNEAALGGAPSGWLCTPPGPTGDGDEPGSYLGDGDPATGQAFIGCYTAGDSSTASGTTVLVVVQFQAVAAGTSTVSVLDHEQTGLYLGSGFAPAGDCGREIPVPCRSASINVTN